MNDKERDIYLINLLLNKYENSNLLLADEAINEIVEEEGIKKLELEKIILSNQQYINDKLNLDQMVFEFVCAFNNDDLLQNDLEIICNDSKLFYEYYHLVIKLYRELIDIKEKEIGYMDSANKIFLSILSLYIFKEYFNKEFQKRNFKKHIKEG